MFATIWRRRRQLCAPDSPHAWMETQKQRLKNNDGPEVLTQLRDYVEAEEVANDHAPGACVFSVFE